MTVFYLDASAIAKFYLRDERGAPLVVQLLESLSLEDRFVTSVLSIVEVKSALSRRIDAPYDRISLLAIYDIDAREIFELIPVDDSIIMGAGDIVETYRLRAGDAIHLATALDITADTPQVFLVSSDAELLEASDAARLGVLDPQADDSTSRLSNIRNAAD